MITLGPYEVLLYIFVAGVAATMIWRFAGLILSTGVSEDGAIISWVRAVSTALVAGLIAKLLLFPPGALADVSLVIRIGAFALGIAAFFLLRRNMGLGILAGTAALITAYALFG